MANNISANEILKKENGLIAQHNQDQHVIVINSGKKKGQKLNHQKMQVQDNNNNQIDHNNVNPSLLNNLAVHQDNQVVHQDNPIDDQDNHIDDQDNLIDHQDNHLDDQDNQVDPQDNHPQHNPIDENHHLPISFTKILAILSIFIIVISTLPNHQQALQTLQEQVIQQTQTNQHLEAQLKILQKQLDDHLDKHSIQVKQLQARVEDYQQQFVLQKYQIDKQKHELIFCQEALRNNTVTDGSKQDAGEIIEEQRKEIIACQDSMKDQILKYIATQQQLG